MTDLIMNLVDSYGFAENRKDDGQALYARNLVEVKIAELTAERDAYAKCADDMAAAHKVERDALKDAARQALDALNTCETEGEQVRYSTYDTESVGSAIAALKAVL